MSSPSGSGASGEYHHIYIGPAGGTDTTPSFANFQIDHNLIADTVRRRGIYTKRGGKLDFNQITGKGPGLSGIRHGGGGSFSGNRCNSIDSVLVNGPNHQIKGNFVRARRGIVLECERRTPSGIRYNAANNALLVNNDANQVMVGNFESGDTLVANVSGVRIYNHRGLPWRSCSRSTPSRPRTSRQTAPTPITLLIEPGRPGRALAQRGGEKGADLGARPRRRGPGVARPLGPGPLPEGEPMAASRSGRGSPGRGAR